MSAFLDVCEKQFSTRNLYKIFDLDQQATTAEGMLLSRMRYISILIRNFRSNLIQKRNFFSEIRIS